MNKWVFPEIGIPQNGWFIMENLIKMDDLGVPLFLETPICSYFWGSLIRRDRQQKIMIPRAAKQVFSGLQMEYDMKNFSFPKTFPRECAEQMLADITLESIEKTHYVFFSQTTNIDIDKKLVLLCAFPAVFFFVDRADDVQVPKVFWPPRHPFLGALPQWNGRLENSRSEGLSKKPCCWGVKCRERTHWRECTTGNAQVQPGKISIFLVIFRPKSLETNKNLSQEVLIFNFLLCVFFGKLHLKTWLFKRFYIGCSKKHTSTKWKTRVITLQGTNISHQNHFWRWFSFSQGGIC